MVRPTVRYLPEGMPDDGLERGIAAFVICASLIRQFEFAQNVWTNDRNFHELGNERDPIDQLPPDHLFVLSSHICSAAEHQHPPRNIPALLLALSPSPPPPPGHKKKKKKCCCGGQVFFPSSSSPGAQAGARGGYMA